MHRGERFLCCLGDVGGLWRIEAEVTFSQGGALTWVLEHCIELAHFARLHGLYRAVDLSHVDTPQRPGKVGGGIERDPLGRGTIAPGTADLLPIGLDGGRR